MGTVNYAVHHVGAGNMFLVRWASLSTSSNGADSGIPFPSSIDLGLAGALFSDKSVQVYQFSQTASTEGANVLIQGANNMSVTESGGIVWATLTDAQGNPLQFDGLARPFRIEEVLENPFYIRPLVTSVTNTNFATQTVTIELLISSVRSSRSGI